MSLLLAPSKPEAVDLMMGANRAQSSVGLQMQGYCNSVLAQPKVSFGGFENLAKLEAEINAGITNAQGRATHYLNDIQPLIIRNITNMSNYFDLHAAVSTTLPPGATKKEWLETLAAVKEAADGYKEDAQGIVVLLQGLHGGLTTDVASFASAVSRLNAAVDGDNGVLAGIDKELDDIEGKIAGAITGIVLSGLAVVGGGIMILVGALAEAVTGGAATLLIVGGVAVLAAGVGGAIGSGLALGGLLSAKSDLLGKKSSLKAEVAFAQGVSTGLDALRGQAGQAVEAATKMSSAWSYLSADLDSLSTDLKKGIIETGTLQRIWLTTANTAIVRARGDIGTIKEQMTGVQNVKAPRGMEISQFVQDTAKKLDAAA